MVDRPILFSAPMVRALLDGSKTQTRRVVKPRLIPIVEECLRVNGRWVYDTLEYDLGAISGRPSDLLWVRETTKADEATSDAVTLAKYAADGAPVLYHGPEEDERGEPDYGGSIAHWWYSKNACPSIHMPRWASRLTLGLIEVRVERLQDISEEDAQAEGVEPLCFEREDRDCSVCPKCGGTRLHNGLGVNYGVIFDMDCMACDTYKKRYQHLWNSINGPNAWQANPWVWVRTFKVDQRNVNQDAASKGSF